MIVGSQGCVSDISENSMKSCEVGEVDGAA